MPSGFRWHSFLVCAGYLFDTFTFTIKGGEHDYMFGVCSDVYWYSNMTNCVKLECGGELININMEILQGD